MSDTEALDQQATADAKAADADGAVWSEVDVIARAREQFAVNGGDVDDMLWCAVGIGVSGDTDQLGGANSPYGERDERTLAYALFKLSAELGCEAGAHNECVMRLMSLIPLTAAQRADPRFQFDGPLPQLEVPYEKCDQMLTPALPFAIMGRITICNSCSVAIRIRCTLPCHEPVYRGFSFVRSFTAMT